MRHGGSIVETSNFRPLFGRTLIVNGGYDAERAEQVLAAGGVVVSDQPLPGLAGAAGITALDLPTGVRAGASATGLTCS